MTLRGVRLCSGLVLFAYVALHLADHMLLNVSVDSAETMLGWMKAVWQSLPGAIVLYSAMTCHLLLAFWALYERRHFMWRLEEAVQLVLGFCIPVLLANHILVTRVSLSAFGTEKGYPHELYSFWVGNIPFGIIQHVVLVVAWAHGCLGVYFWLRLKPWFKAVAPVLLSGAVLLPALALLGSFQGGRITQRLAKDPEWAARYLTPDQVGTATQNATLDATLTASWVVFAVCVLIVLGGRGLRTLRERRRGLIRISYVDGRTVRVPKGLTVLEASRLYRVPHTSVCGGRGRCTTCRIRVFSQPDDLPEPTGGEQAALKRVSAEAHVRLACQLRPRSDLRLSLLLPPGQKPRRPMRGGEEQYLVIMFVDLRGSTRLAEQRLPFDTVFVVNSFLAAVGRAVSAAGGVANQMLGDGLLGLFGLRTDRETAARQALEAAAGIARNVAALNEQLVSDLQAPLQYGIGINGGVVIVGDVGYEDYTVFTALGDPVNVAARLEGMTKDYACALLVTDPVYRDAGRPEEAWPLHVVTPRGREAPLSVRVATASELMAEQSRTMISGI
jgi:adenylate cyclase